MSTPSKAARDALDAMIAEVKGDMLRVRREARECAKSAMRVLEYESPDLTVVRDQLAEATRAIGLYAGLRDALGILEVSSLVDDVKEAEGES